MKARNNDAVYTVCSNKPGCLTPGCLHHSYSECRAFFLHETIGDSTLRPGEPGLSTRCTVASHATDTPR